MIVSGQSIAASDGVTTVLLYIRNKSGPDETRPLVSYTKRPIWLMRGERSREQRLRNRIHGAGGVLDRTGPGDGAR